MCILILISMKHRLFRRSCRVCTCIVQFGLDISCSHSAPDVPRPSHFDFNQRVFWGLLYAAISHADL